MRLYKTTRAAGQTPSVEWSRKKPFMTEHHLKRFQVMKIERVHVPTYGLEAMEIFMQREADGREQPDAETIYER